MRIGKHLRRAISEGYGNDFLKDVLSPFALSESECKRPWLHREDLQKKLDNAKAIDLMDLYEGSFGSVRASAFEDSDWERTHSLMASAAHKTQMNEHAAPTARIQLSEAETMAQAFNLLTQAKLFTTMQATYELTPAVYEGLFGTFDSPYPTYNHQIPSDAPVVEFIREGEEYKERTLVDRYCTTKANKFGARISLTRETLIADKTGQVVAQCEALAASAKYREDELAALCWADSSNSTLIPDAAEQDAGCFYPEGTNAALYRTSAGATKPTYTSSINRVSGQNNLLQWDNIIKGIILLKQMVNPRSGQYVDVIGNGAMKLVVPVGLEARALLLTTPGTMNYVSQNSSAGTQSSMIRTPDGMQRLGVGSLQVVVWNKLSTAATASQSVWYLAGDSTKQFRKHQQWATEFMRASQPQLGGDDFKRDVILSVRGGFRAGFRAVDDKYVIMNANS